MPQTVLECWRGFESNVLGDHTAESKRALAPPFFAGCVGMYSLIYRTLTAAISRAPDEDHRTLVMESGQQLRGFGEEAAELLIEAAAVANGYKK